MSDENVERGAMNTLRDRWERIVASAKDGTAHVAIEVAGTYDPFARAINALLARAARPREAGKGETKPEVVCLCGSTRFIETFQAEYGRLTDEGKIVLTVGRVVPQSEQALGSTRKVALDALHLRKIDLADRVLVLNVGGYVGPSTRREIAYAKECGKPIDLLYPDAGLDGLPPPLAPEACPVAEKPLAWTAFSESSSWTGVWCKTREGAQERVDEFKRRWPKTGPYRVVPLYATPASAAGREGAFGGYERERAAFDAWWADKSDGFKRATAKGANLSGVAWDAYYARALLAAEAEGGGE